MQCAAECGALCVMHSVYSDDVLWLCCSVCCSALQSVMDYVSCILIMCHAFCVHCCCVVAVLQYMLRRVAECGVLCVMHSVYNPVVLSLCCSACCSALQSVVHYAPCIMCTALLFYHFVAICGVVQCVVHSV